MKLIELKSFDALKHKENLYSRERIREIRERRQQDGFYLKCCNKFFFVFIGWIQSDVRLKKDSMRHRQNVTGHEAA